MKESKMEDKIIMVKFGEKTYPTHIVDGVQRFIANKDNCDKFDRREIDLNKMAMDVTTGRMSEQDLLEIRMSLGYSVQGLADCYSDYEIINPLWNKHKEYN
jgi:hypothetical protein